MARYITEQRAFQIHPCWQRDYKMKSKRESRFALLLEKLVYQGSVIQWWYEPHKFRCKRLYRNERLYTPDFLVHLQDDIFDTGTKSVWVEVKAKLDQNGKTRFHCLYSTLPWIKDRMLLIVDREPTGNSKTARRQRVLQDGSLRFIRRVLYASEYYPKFGIR